MAGLRAWWTTAPTWVKIFGIVAAVVLVVLVAVAALGGGPGGHGPARHGSGSDAGPSDLDDNGPAAARVANVAAKMLAFRPATLAFAETHP